MIDPYAVILYNMENYGTPYPPKGSEREEIDFAKAPLDAMSTPLSDETSFQKLNRLYPGWLDILPRHQNDI